MTATTRDDDKGRMRHRATHGMVVGLAFVVVGCVLPGIGLLGAERLAASAVKRRAHVGQVAIATDAALRLRGGLDDRRHFVHAIAAQGQVDRGVLPGGPPACSWTSRDANNNVKVVLRPPGAGPAGCQGATFTEPPIGQDWVISGAGPHALVSVVAVTLGPDGDQTGRVEAVFPFAELAGRITFGRTGAITIVDAAGMVIEATVPDAEGKPLRAAKAQALVAAGRPEVAELYALALRTKIVTSYQPVPEWGLGVFASEQSKDVYADVAELNRRLRVGWLAIVAFAILGGIAIARLVHQRDRRLAADRRRLASVAAELSAAVDELQRAKVEKTRVFDALYEGVALYGRDGRLEDWNPALPAMLGVDPHVVGGTGLMSADFRTIREDGTDWPFDEIPATVAAREHRPVSADVLGLVGPDGATRWLSVYAVPLEVAEGDDGPAPVVVSVVDITLRLEAQRALRASDAERAELEAVQRACLDALGEGVSMSTLTGEVRLLNQCGQQLLGITAEQLTARVAAGEWHTYRENGELLPTEERPVFHTMATGEPTSGRIIRWASADGGTRLLRVSTEPVRDAAGTLVGVVTAFADVTAERAAEAEREALHARFRAAFQNAPFGIEVAGPTAVLECNSEIERIAGRPAEELLGIGLAPLLVPEDAAALAVGLAASEAAGEPVFTTECRLVRPDGSIRWIKGSIVQVAGDPEVTRIVNVEDITERREKAQALSEAETELRRSFDDAVVGLAIIELDGRCRRANAALCRMLGRTSDEVVGAAFTSFTHEADRELAMERDRQLLAGEIESYQLDKRFLRPDGTVVWARVSKGLVADANGAPLHVISQIEDVTAARDAQAALLASHARFEALVERSSDVICVVDAAGRIAYSSPAGVRMLGAGTRAIEGEVLAELVHPEDGPRLAAVFADVATRPSATATTSVRVGGAHGRWHYLEVVATNRLDDPNVHGIVANVRDVTERAEAAARLSWQAFHDALTGLPNRSLLMDRLGHALDRAKRSGDQTAVLFVDLDRFKLVNDTMGHEAGDMLIIEIAARLLSVVRTGDTVARLGGDEFVILAESLRNPAEAEVIAARVIEALSTPIHLDPNGPVTVTASVGIAYALEHDPQTLLQEADIALYRAKEQGKNRFEVFSDSLRVEALRRLTTEQTLRRALADDGLVLYYQPIVELASGRVTSAEALLRLKTPGGRPKLPAEFIQVAEESGLIVPVGAEVLNLACAQLAAWRDVHTGALPCRVAVNVSGRQLALTSFVDTLLHALDRHQLQPEDLTLEFTESTVIGADRGTLRSVEALHALGVGLAIDDFGTGYSSLAYLTRLPIDTVKLDRAFVEGLGSNRQNDEIAQAIVSLGAALGLSVVAEGIETTDQLRTLRRLGCSHGQGYLLAKPAPAEDYPAQRAAAELVMSLT